jgi:hypothetical protein
MKYTIETTETGCIETLELNNGKKYVKRKTGTQYSLKDEDDDFFFLCRWRMMVSVMMNFLIKSMKHLTVS